MGENALRGVDCPAQIGGILMEMSHQEPAEEAARNADERGDGKTPWQGGRGRWRVARDWFGHELITVAIETSPQPEHL